MYSKDILLNGGDRMIITDKKIRKLVKDDNLITPFKEELLQSESYDITIGNKIVTFKKEIKCLDIANQKEIDDIYLESDLTSEGYVISPKEYVLVSLGETIKLPDNISAHLRPKTRYTRLGLIVSDQHCNSSYEGHLRIGIFNATEYPIRIHSGISIAQLVFEELDEVASEEKLYRNKKDAHYHKENGEFRGAKIDDSILDEIIEEMFK